MFKFLKEKLKQAISSVSKKVETETKDEEIEIPKEPAPSLPTKQEKKIPEETKKKPENKIPNEKHSVQLKEEEQVAERAPEQSAKPSEAKGFFSRLKERFTEEKSGTPPREETLEPLQEKPEEAIRETLPPKAIPSKASPKALPTEQDRSKTRHDSPRLKPQIQAVPKPESEKSPLKESSLQESSLQESPPHHKADHTQPRHEEPTPPAETVPQPTIQEAVTNEESVEKPAESKGFFSRLTEKVLAKKISATQFDAIFWDLEIALLENNVAVDVIEKIKNDLKRDIVDVPIRRGKIEDVITEHLRQSIEELFPKTHVDIIKAIRAKKDKPYVICFIGINGSGKTTTIAKVAKLLQDNNLSCVLAAGDTFRAAAIDQLDYHGEKLGVRVIKHQYGSDPAAVVFDAIKHATSKNIDAVLIDTAGRLHSNVNLMEELRKIIRIAKPDMKIFIGESITGNDCVEQARQFDEAVGIDQIILSKADVDEKGGAAISVSYITKKPISYLGTGQEYQDLEPFSSEKILEQMGLST